MTIYEQPWRLIPNKIRASGGRELDRFRGINPPQDTPNGAEAWVGSMTRANGATKDNPNLGCAEVLLPNGKREYLFSAVLSAPEKVLGEKHMAYYGNSLGMLIKMIDAKKPFLLQCHPTRGNAQKYWNSQFGKEECWFVLGTRQDMEEEPYILLGFREGITRQEFEKAYRQGDIQRLEGMCHKIKVKPGECYLIPGGVPHALGAGCFVAEIQEPSDLTAVPFSQAYLLDYRRKANPLGVFVAEDESLYETRMLNTFHYEGSSKEELLSRLKSKERILREETGGKEIEIFGDADTKSFSCTVVRVTKEISRVNTGDVQIGIVLSGQGNIRCGQITIPVQQGSELFFPCSVRDAVFEGDFSVILCNPGVTASYRPSQT